VVGVHGAGVGGAGVGGWGGVVGVSGGWGGGGGGGGDVWGGEYLTCARGLRMPFGLFLMHSSPFSK